MVQFACRAAELNSLDLLENIVRYGGNVTLPRSDGTTALHHAVSEANLKVAKFLLDQGADMDKPDINGWTPRTLADQQGHEEIKALFNAKKECNNHTVTISEQPRVPFIGKFRSEPAIHHFSQEGTLLTGNGPLENSSSLRRRKTNSFHNSLFGIMRAAHTGEKSSISLMGPTRSTRKCGVYPIRVTIRCPEKGEAAGKLVQLPESLQELLDLGAKKFGCAPNKVLTKDRAEIDDIELIRDGDHLILISDAGA